MPTCFAKAASRAAAARQQRDRPTEQARRIKAELSSLHVISSFAAPSSHLYHAADTTTPRPPGGTELPWGSPLRHVSAGLGTSIVNVLGQPQRLPLPALSTTRAGVPMQESVRAIMARGGASAASVLPADSEIRLYEESKGSLADRAAMTQGTAAEIMSRDTCVAARPCPAPAPVNPKSHLHHSSFHPPPHTHTPLCAALTPCSSSLQKSPSTARTGRTTRCTLQTLTGKSTRGAGLPIPMQSFSRSLQ